MAGEGHALHSSPQDQYLEIKSTMDRGLAVFAVRKIKAGTLIHCEDPLFSLCKDEEDDHSAIQREFSKLPRASQRRFLKLFDAEKSRMPRVVSIYYSNCYNLDSFAPDGRGGSAIGDLSSRFNHSCIPNVQFSYNFDRRQMMFYAIRDIPRGKEVCSSYDKNLFEIATRRRQKLQMYYAFVCHCEACEGANKNEFWGRSDERRTAMRDAFKRVQCCEKVFLNENIEAQEPRFEHKDRAIEEARSALGKLETLLLKEGLTGVVLANIYRSLSKWSERKQLLVETVKWKEMERLHCELGLGGHALRTKEAAEKLADLKGRFPA
ncbi:uncharacterized protein A1O9_00119 [Exophiala aquamarina CBS 119918]|uniref:SET domain-containing protein n=1 Tax=Exophiala aquamarina CBS 119918 TaxID=1182545 RepID=A0A072PQX0_9EURO|nr:uncharacterized protein A1O9_00119 [Exophiala aquamarina CBS 119918]KEF62147.1 hypothetical protein A1O9_00119 [Exophiala aquamarina CBS 119918]